MHNTTVYGCSVALGTLWRSFVLASVLVFGVFSGIGCQDSRLDVDVVCWPSRTGEVTWSVTIVPSFDNSLVLYGDMTGSVQVSDASSSIPGAALPSPWHVSHKVTVRKAADSGMFDVFFGDTARKGSANTEAGAWDLARKEFIGAVRVEISSWIQGDILGPDLMRKPQHGHRYSGQSPISEPNNR